MIVTKSDKESELSLIKENQGCHLYHRIACEAWRVFSHTVQTSTTTTTGRVACDGLVWPTLSCAMWEHGWRGTILMRSLVIITSLTLDVVYLCCLLWLFEA